MTNIQAAYIDDEQPLLEVAKSFLEMDGDLKLDVFEIVWEAFSALTERSYDVIVCDYQMPEMDGLEVLKTLRENGSHVPFILFTGKGREEVAMEALNLGADRYIQKGGDAKAQFVELKHAVIQLHQRVRAENELEKSNRELEVLYQATGELVGAFDLEAISATIFNAVSAVMDVDTVIVSSFDKRTSTIYTESVIKGGRSADISHFPPAPLEREGHGTQSHVIRSGKPLLIPDMRALINSTKAHCTFDAKGNVRDFAPEEGPDEARSAVMMPLKHEGVVIGVLSIMSNKEDAFKEKDLRFLEPLAGNAAAAISLSRMHQEARLELDRRGQAEHQRLLMEAMMETCENGIMIWHLGDGARDIHPVIWNPAAAKLLFGSEGEGFSNLKDCSTLLSQDLDMLAREAKQLGKQIKVLVVREGTQEHQLMEVSITPLDSEHVGLMMVPR